MQRLKQLEDENRRLKHIVAEQTVDIQAMTAVIDVGQGLSGQDVVATLERLRCERGLPQRIYCDNGTEFVSAAMDLWAYTNRVLLDFSRRGNRLNVHWFASLEVPSRSFPFGALARLGDNRLQTAV
jgi:hypothetical protein